MVPAPSVSRGELAMFALAVAAVLSVPPNATVATQPLEPPAQVMALSPEMRLRLKNEVTDRASSQRERFNRLLHLFFDPNGLNLAYNDDATQSVSKTYATRSANCLSFTMTFTAMAREVGLDARPQEMRKTLAWRQIGGILYRVDHINTVVTIHGTGYLVDILRDSVIHLDKPQPVSDQRLLALYFNNRAMFDLERGQLQSARQNMDEALALDPGLATSWNNAGVLLARDGNPSAALQAYEKALSIEPDNASALANMTELAQRQNDPVRARQLRDRLEQLQQADPLYHFLQAEIDEQAGDFPRAIGHYQKAARLHGEEPRFYDALARVYLKSGDRESAIRSLRHAMRWSTGPERDGYRKQVDALQGN